MYFRKILENICLMFLKYIGSTCGYLFEENENTNSKRYIHTLYIYVVTIAMIWKRPQCPSTDEWIKKMAYIHNEILRSHKKSNILPFVITWMDLECIILNEISQRKTNAI